MNDQHSDAESGRGTLRDKLPAVAAPPMREHLQASLSSRGLVGRPRDRRVEWVVRLSLLAAGIVFGAFFGTTRVTPDGSIPANSAGAPTPQFALLLYDTPANDTGSIAGRRAEEYGRWAATLPGARFVSGSELGDVLSVIGPTGSNRAPEPPAGYFIIEAPSVARAVAIARTCPHVRYGGRVVVMSIPDRATQ